MNSKAILSCFPVLFLALTSKAEITTQTVPEGVRSPSVRVGTVSQLSQKYNDSGNLANMVDVRSIEFNSKRLSVVEPKIDQLVGLFNRMGKYDLGSQMNKGTLRIDSKPYVQYTGAVMAYGMNERWTLGAGIPVVHYTNNTSLSTTASNIAAFKSIASQLGVAELSQGLQQLDDVDLIAAFHDELKKKGYNELQKQDQTFLGDTQLVSLYKLDDLKTSFGTIQSLFRLNVILPTGPQYNPDNLAALNQFGYTYIEPQIIASIPVVDHLSVAGLLGVRYYVPDQITARVPLDEGDILPGDEQKEVVKRRVGFKLTQSVQLNYSASESWSLFGISEWSQKAADQFQGGGNKRYDLLGRDTDTQTTIVTGGVTYSTVAAYQKRKQGIPAMLTAQISDTIAGKNTERQLVQEISGTLFF